MSYIDESLGPDETLLYRAHFHWLNFAAAWAALIALVALASWIVFYAAGWVDVALLSGCGLGLVILLRKMMPIWTTEIGVTNHRLILKRGWMARSTDELQLKAIEQVNFDQGFLGRIFGFGSVNVHGTGVDDLHIPVVAAPVDFLKAIECASSQSKIMVPAAELPPVLRTPS